MEHIKLYMGYPRQCLRCQQINGKRKRGARWDLGIKGHEPKVACRPCLNPDSSKVHVLKKKKKDK